MKRFYFLLVAIIMLVNVSPEAKAAKLNYSVAVTDPDTFPVPRMPRQLFYIQRDPNTNTIVYELNLDKDGKLIANKPIHPYWIRYPEGGGKKELNYIQRTFAYAIDHTLQADGSYELRAFAYNKHPLYLRKDEKGIWKVYTEINKKQCVLHRIFVRIDGGSFWNPNVLYVEMRGTDPTTGKVVAERILKPKKTSSTPN